MITAREMLEKARAKKACEEALEWLASLNHDCDPLTVPHEKSAEWALWYADQVLNRRWPEGEEVIASDPYTAYFYARDIIKGRWTEAEEVISRAPDAAYCYATDVIKGRWPEAEKKIIKSPYYALYRKFIK